MQARKGEAIKKNEQLSTAVATGVFQNGTGDGRNVSKTG